MVFEALTLTLTLSLTLSRHHGLEARLERGDVAVHAREGAGGAELRGGGVAPGEGGGVDGLA